MLPQLKLIDYVLGYNCFGKFAHSFESIIAENWHHTRNNWHIYSCFTAVPNPVEKDLIIVKELRNDEVSASLYFCLQVHNVIVT